MIDKIYLIYECNGGEQPFPYTEKILGFVFSEEEAELQIKMFPKNKNPFIKYRYEKIYTLRLILC
jgi:hypothetical protein